MTETPSTEPIEDVEETDPIDNEEFVPNPDEDLDWDNDRDGSMADFADQEPDDNDVED